MVSCFNSNEPKTWSELLKSKPKQVQQRQKRLKAAMVRLNPNREVKKKVISAHDVNKPINDVAIPDKEDTIKTDTIFIKTDTISTEEQILNNQTDSIDITQSDSGNYRDSTLINEKTTEITQVEDKLSRSERRKLERKKRKELREFRDKVINGN